MILNTMSNNHITHFNTLVSNEYQKSRYAHINAHTTHIIHNLSTIDLLNSLPIRQNLKRLLSKWTTPVIAIARLRGKKTANTGKSMVPIQNPEKKVRSDAKNAIIIGKSIDIYMYLKD